MAWQARVIPRPCLSKAVSGPATRADADIDFCEDVDLGSDTDFQRDDDGIRHLPDKTLGRRPATNLKFEPLLIDEDGRIGP